jgi:hypothetical protein
MVPSATAISRRPAALRCEHLPGFAEGRVAHVLGGAGRIARLLLPQRGEVQDHRQERRTLDALDEANLGEMRQDRTEDQRRDHHAQHHHHAKQRDDLGMVGLRREIRRKRETGGLHRVQAGAHQEKCERRGALPHDRRRRRVAAEQNESERHDRESAELQHRPEPQVGNAPPSERGTMGIRLEADERTERREDQRQRDHRRDEPHRNAEFDDHHAVQRADQQHHGHADGDLEQRKAQQPAERQLGRRGVREREQAEADGHPRARHSFRGPGHASTTSWT